MPQAATIVSPRTVERSPHPVTTSYAPATMASGSNIVTYTPIMKTSVRGSPAKVTEGLKCIQVMYFRCLRWKHALLSQRQAWDRKQHWLYLKCKHFQLQSTPKILSERNIRLGKRKWKWSPRKQCHLWMLLFNRKWESSSFISLSGYFRREHFIKRHYNSNKCRLRRCRGQITTLYWLRT